MFESRTGDEAKALGRKSHGDRLAAPPRRRRRHRGGVGGDCRLGGGRRAAVRGEVSVKAMFVLPFATADAPRWLHRALQIRAIATITGTCPACGATLDPGEIRPGEVHTPVLWHESDCAAGDSRLQSAAVLPQWVELRVISIDLPDEAVA